MIRIIRGVDRLIDRALGEGEEPMRLSMPPRWRESFKLELQEIAKNRIMVTDPKATVDKYRGCEIGTALPTQNSIGLTCTSGKTLLL